MRRYATVRRSEVPLGDDVVAPLDGWMRRTTACSSKRWWTSAGARCRWRMRAESCSRRREPAEPHRMIQTGCASTWRDFSWTGQPCREARRSH